MMLVRPRWKIMEAVIFIGLQAAGKSTFYKERFFRTHVRINLDMLRTRRREQLILEACLAARQPFVVDNTNPTVEERARYLAAARASRFHIVGYYFLPDIRQALARNEARTGKERLPLKGIFGTLKRLQPPTLAEGYDALYSVSTEIEGEFRVAEWNQEATRG